MVESDDREWRGQSEFDMRDVSEIILKKKKSY